MVRTRAPRAAAVVRSGGEAGERGRGQRVGAAEARPLSGGLGTGEWGRRGRLALRSSCSERSGWGERRAGEEGARFRGLRGGGGTRGRRAPPTAGGDCGRSGAPGGTGLQPLLPCWLQETIRLLPLRPQAESKGWERDGAGGRAVGADCDGDPCFVCAERITT